MLDIAAYQGDGWVAREADLVDFSAPSEWAPLARAALFPPDRQWPTPREGWNAVQYAQAVDFEALAKEVAALADVLAGEGVDVDVLDEPTVGDPSYNRMFMRDGLLATPWGVILGRFASRGRAAEERDLRRYVLSAELPVLASVRVGTFEAADALWLSEREVLLGIGNRTSAAGARFVVGLLRALGVQVYEILLPRTVQHLLGLVQLVGPDLAVLRGQIAPPELLRILDERGFGVVDVPEDEEVQLHQAMNVVVLGERSVVMPDGCRNMERSLTAHGVTVRTTPCFQLAAAAGGLACATGVIRRMVTAAP